MKTFCYTCLFEDEDGLTEATHHCSICDEDFCDTCFKWHEAEFCKLKKNNETSPNS